MRQEFDGLRNAALLERDPETRRRRLAEVDELERLSQEVNESISALTKEPQENKTKTLLGMPMGVPMEWLFVIGLTAVVLSITCAFKRTYEESDVVLGMFVLPICGFCVIAALRLKSRVLASRKLESGKAQSQNPTLRLPGSV